MPRKAKGTTFVSDGSLAAGEFIDCSEAINADPCNALQTVTSDPKCAGIEDCAFGQ